MRILIDTHVLIWHLNGDEKLPTYIIELIESTDNEIIISIVTLWELAIKISKEKLDLEISLEDIRKYISNKNVEILNIHFNALTKLIELPYHHKDPFDRLLIAQSISENIPIISADRHFPSYPVTLIW